MSQFRWATKVVFGPWLATRHAAMKNALEYRQATASESRGHKITLKDFAKIEARPTPELPDLRAFVSVG